VLTLLLTDISVQVEVAYQKELNKRSETLVASMTHELRTPLNGVIGLQECAIENMGEKSENV